MLIQKSSEGTELSQVEERFRQVLLEAIDEGLLMLGENSRKAVYFHLQNMFSLKKEDVPDRPEVLVRGLEKIFGAGAKAIETWILKSLYQKLGAKYEEKKNSQFEDHLNDAREIIRSECHKKGVGLNGAPAGI